MIPHRDDRAVAATAGKTALVVFTALVLQVSLVARFSVDGARGDVLLLVALSAAAVAGPEKGAIVGFAAGLAFDLVLATPFGLSALVYCLAGYVAGSFWGSVLRVTWWMPVVSVVAGSVGAMILSALIGALLDQATLSGPPLTTSVAVVAVLNGLLAPLSTRALRWALADTRRARFAPR